MNLIYNKFSDDYDSLYLENIRQFIERIKEVNKDDDNEFIDFYPCFGVKKNEKSDFLIYGQAPNGWRSGFQLDDNINLEKVHDSYCQSNKFLSERNHSPLDWVNVQWSNSDYNRNCNDSLSKEFYNGSYRAYRSFFWNVIYKLICDYYQIDRESWEWSKKIVWSNLYKIAPANANPNGFYKSQQHPLASELVKKEIEEINPKYCIVITNGDWWKPFHEALNTTIIKEEVLGSDSEIFSFEKFNQTKIIITNRPRFGNSNKFVRQILELIKSKE